MNIPKSYGIENLSFRDDSRTADYNLVRVQGSTTFNFPINGPECTYAFPSVLTEMSCTESMEMYENDRYTKQEIDNLIQDIEIEATDRLNKKKVNVKDKSQVTADMVGTIDLFGTILHVNKV